MPDAKLIGFLDENHIKYQTLNHTQAFTAHEIAATSHVPAKELAKTVIVKVDGKMMMTVLPASHRINLLKLEEALHADYVELATEDEFSSIFPGCSVGAMPPLGNLYGLDVVVAERLTQDKEIAFNAGTHTELVKMSYSDYERLVHPIVIQFT